MLEREDWVFRRKTCNGLNERALGIAVEMIFGGNTCRNQSEVPLPPIVGNGMEVGFKPKSLERKARRRGFKWLSVMGYWLLRGV